MKNKDHARFWGANKLPYGIDVQVRIGTTG